MSHQTAYLARNVVNAPEIKARITERSQQRGDSGDIGTWLQNHFYRYVVGNFVAPPPAVQPIHTIDDLQRRYRNGPPPWAMALVARAAATRKDGAEPALWWINPEGDAILALETRLLEFLQSRVGTSLQGKLMRINCPQALERWEQEHRAFETKQLAGWRSHNPQAVAPLWQGSNGEFVELLPTSKALREEMAYESQMMRHCLGQFANRRHLTGGYGEHYAESCEQGRMRIFSYRTGQQQPRITINAWVQDDGRLRIDQIKGKQNRPPIDRYRADVLGFLNHLSTSDYTPDDALGMRLVRVVSRWYVVEDLVEEADQLQLWRRQPGLLQYLRQLTPLVQWLAATRDSGILESHAITPALAHALQQAGKPVPATRLVAA